MAEASELTLSDQKSLICNICLDLLNTPVTIPCGHSFCKDCITAIWEQQVDHEGCPQCSQTFSRRPHLISCVILKDLIEKLRSRKPQTDAEDHDVRCDACSTRRVKAIKSCLTCLSSYCTLHTEQHNDLHKGKKHQLIEVTDLQRQMCPQHGKLLELFCRTDRQCICLLCVVDEHKNHNIISASDERSEKQGKLMETLMKFLQKVQERENEVKELKNTEESIRRSAQTAVAECERIFPEIICSLQKTCCRVKEVVSDKESSCLKNINGLQVKVQQEITDMKMKISEINQLLSTEDHIYFLQKNTSQSEDCKDPFSISLYEDVPFHNVMMLISAIREHLMDVEIKISGELRSLSSHSASAAQSEGLDTQTICDADVEILFERKPTKEQAELAAKLMLPHTFFCYKNEPGYLSDDDDDDEDFQMAIKSLKGKLYPDLPTQGHEENAECACTAEENEEILFKQRSKLYQFNFTTNQWKVCGNGDIQILYHPLRKHYQILMIRQEGNLKICANHYITKSIEVKPMSSCGNSLVWTATVFTEGEVKVKTLAAKFSTAELAESFRQTFIDCQRRM